MKLKNLLLETIQDNPNCHIKDFLRFNLNTWILPDGFLDEENKYLNLVHVVLSTKEEKMLNLLLGTNIDDWDRQKLLNSLRILLSLHTLYLKDDNELSNLVDEYSQFKINATDYNLLNQKISKDINCDIILFSFSNQDYSWNIGDVISNNGILETSYDPISALSWVLDDIKINKIYCQRLCFVKESKGLLLIENSFYQNKEHHKVLVSSEAKFIVEKIVDKTMFHILDSNGKSRHFLVKVYNLVYQLE